MSCAHSNALRVGRRSEAGRVYLITATTRNREPFFDDWPVAAAVARGLSSADAWPFSELLCWVLMPDHWHAVIVLDREPLSLAVGRAKAIASHAAGQVLGRPLALWAPGFHDRALRQDESLLRVARYVVANPLRAGLVGRLGDYPLWDAAWMGQKIAAEAAPTGERVDAGRRIAVPS